MDRRLQVVECEVLVVPIDGAMVKHEVGGLGGVSVAVHGFGLTMLRVEQVGEDEDEVVAEDSGRVTEDEVDGARDAIGLVELVEGLGVEGILVVKELH